MDILLKYNGFPLPTGVQQAITQEDNIAAPTRKSHPFPAVKRRQLSGFSAAHPVKHSGHMPAGIAVRRNSPAAFRKIGIDDSV